MLRDFIWQSLRKMLPSILDLDIKGIEDIVSEQGYERYRAKQIIEWIYKKGKLDFDGMSNLPAELREFLSCNFSILPFEIIQSYKSEDTVKFLFRTDDDLIFESVVIFHPDRGILCLSTQIGCPVRCRFCASGENFYRNLRYEEIIGQYIFARNYIKRDIRGIVFMGMGEPLLNEESLYRTIDVLTEIIGISPRHITVSTSGIPKGILNIARRNPKVRLALSLWTPEEEEREKLVPVSKIYPLSEVIESLRRYVEITKNRVSIEYTLLKGINDGIGDVHKLISLFRDMPVFFNVILYNPKDEDTKIYQTSVEEALRFVDLLKRSGKEAHLRVSKGGKISGACGQLRAVYERSK